MSTTPPASTTISLVFVNFRSAWYLALALESLRRSEPAWTRAEIIIVNNDATESAVLRELAPIFGFRLLENTSNGGFASGANYGAREASGTIVGFLNPDILWREPFLERLSELLRNPEIGAVGPKLIDIRGREDAFDCGHDATLLRTLIFRPIFRQKASPATIRGLAPCDWISGGALFCSRETFSQIGGFDEAFFLYFEDADFCRRMREQGLRIMKDGQARLIHHGGKSHSVRCVQKAHYYASQTLYFHKYRPLLESVFLHLFRFLRYGI